MNTGLPHVGGGLLQQSAEAQLNNQPLPEVKALQFSSSPAPTTATIVGRNQATGAQVGVSDLGGIVAVSGSAGFSSTVVVSSKPGNAPTGLNAVSVTANLQSAPAAVPTFTLVTDNTPPQELVCPAVPTPVSVECPPGFEATSGPPLVATRPGGCGGDNRYWYRAAAPALPVLPANAQEIERLLFNGDNYLLAQGDAGMPPGIGCAWKYGGVTAFGCKEVVTDFSTNGRLDPANQVLVITKPGGCGSGSRQWYKNQEECPFGSELVDNVDFQGNNYKMCESASPLPPGVGCGWQFGAALNDCSCEFIRAFSDTTMLSANWDLQPILSTVKPSGVSSASQGPGYRLVELNVPVGPNGMGFVGDFALGWESGGPSIKLSASVSCNVISRPLGFNLPQVGVLLRQGSAIFSSLERRNIQDATSTFTFADLTPADFKKFAENGIELNTPSTELPDFTQSYEVGFFFGDTNIPGSQPAYVEPIGFSGASASILCTRC